MGRLPISRSTYLRIPDASDAAELYALIEANRADLARWLPWAASQTFDATVGFIDRAREQTAGDDGFRTGAGAR